MANGLSMLFLLAGAFFFLAGTLGLLRFPDIYTRLHALTKADNVGLGFVVIGSMLQVSSWEQLGKLLLIWALALLTTTTVGQLVGRAADRAGIQPWRGR